MQLCGSTAISNVTFRNDLPCEDLKSDPCIRLMGGALAKLTHCDSRHRSDPVGSQFAIRCTGTKNILVIQEQINTFSLDTCKKSRFPVREPEVAELPARVSPGFRTAYRELLWFLQGASQLGLANKEAQ